MPFKQEKYFSDHILNFSNSYSDSILSTPLFLIWHLLLRQVARTKQGYLPY